MVIIILILGLLILLFLTYISWEPVSGWEKEGFMDAVNGVPEPSAEDLIKKGYSSQYIKHYLEGYRKWAP